MLQDARAVRYYQRITDAFAEQWHRGYRTDDLRLFLEGYLAALRHSESIEPYLIHRVEEEATRYLYDTSNFSNPEAEPDFYY